MSAVLSFVLKLKKNDLKYKLCPYSYVGRLIFTYEAVENNQKPSTWFMRNGSFLRLKSLEFGYTVPTNVLKKVFVKNFRIYFSGTNLLTFSPFKLWDPEMGGNGLGYPVQRVFNLGAQISF